MSLTDYIPNLFGSNDEDAPTTEELADLFREREATIDLTAEFHAPNPNMTDEPTAVFPYTLFNSEGEVYGTGAKEFIVPDDGFDDDDANVTEFVSDLTGRDDVTVDALTAVEGQTADAELDNGDVIVSVSGVDA